MRKLITTLLFFFIYAISFARGWYFSGSGNDVTGNGTIGNPYVSIAKLNTLWASINAGDQILFNRGDVFMGIIRPTKSGSAGNPITISAYGTGAKPIISGLSTLTGWANIGGNIWECTPSVALQADFNVLTINGQPSAVGRTPNANTFYTYQSATPTTLTSSTLTGTPSYVGAQIVIRANGFQTEKCTVTAQSTSTVTFANNTQPIDNGNIGGTNNGKAGFGFFFQRFAASLDVQGEWYFNSGTNKVQIYSTVNPNTLTIKASFADTVIALANRTNFVVDGLSIEGASLYGLQTQTGSDITVKNCYLNNNTRALYGWNTNDILIDSNIINNSFNSAILVSNLTQRKRVTITNNIITNTGQLTGMGAFPSSNNFKGVVVKTDSATINTYVNIIKNTIIKTGYDGIEFQGSNVTVNKNRIDTFCTAQGDGGAIYTWINNTSINNINYTNRIVDSNFCSNGIGDAAGSGGQIQVNGIYMDDQTRNVLMRGDIVWNIPGNGVSANNPLNQRFSYGTIYNCGVVYSIVQKPFGPLSGNFVTQNVLYQKLNTQYNFFHNNDNLSQPPPPITIIQSMQRMSYIDSNWISTLSAAGYRFYYSSDGVTYTFPSPTTLANWRSSILHDIVSITPPTVLSNTNTAIYVNPSDTVLRVDWDGFQKVDPKGMTYNNFAYIPAWSSLIAINNGTATPINKYPVVTATAGADSVLTLPSNIAHLTGSASDTDGVITSYTWSQISGPSTVSGLPFTTTGTPNFNATGLIEGIYQFQLAATDNGGATSTTIVRVTVNAAIPNTPPTANAGVDKTITLPTTSTSVTGTGTNGSGTSRTYSWMQTSGPATVSFGSSTSATTTINNLTVDGTYTMKLTVTNNLGDTASDYMQVFVNPAPIVLPTANAGSDKAITLPTTSTSATATATLGSGTLTSYTWSFVTGPTTATFGSANSLTTTINNLTIVGTYTVKFTVLNSQGNSASDNLDIVVSPAIPPVNQPPVSVPGANQTITLPTNTVTVNGSGSTDPDGTITAYQWTITGPNTATSTTPNAVSTTFGNLIVGTYQARLRVTDNNSDTGSASLTITVLAAPNVLPTAVAGANQVLTLPTNSTTVNGSGSSDPDGITAYGWVQISGPSAATIASPATAITGISNMIAGDYVFQLKVTGSNGSSDTAVDALMITVNPAPVLNPPIAFAGADSIVQLPQNIVHLLGGGTNGTGTITSHVWSVFSGPTGSFFDNANNYNVIVSGLAEGTYLFKLTVTDSNGLTGTDLVQVVVRPVIQAGIKVLLGYDIHVN